MSKFFIEEAVTYTVDVPDDYDVDDEALGLDEPDAYRSAEVYQQERGRALALNYFLNLEGREFVELPVTVNEREVYEANE